MIILKLSCISDFFRKFEMENEIKRKTKRKVEREKKT